MFSKLYRKIFRTRLEVEHLQRQLDDLTSMLKGHFGILWDLDDFKNYTESHPEDKNIPVTDGKFLHFDDMLKPSIRNAQFKTTIIDREGTPRSLSSADINPTAPLSETSLFYRGIALRNSQKLPSTRKLPSK